MVATQESITAKLCSFARAYHSNYSKIKIFDDFLAYDLMGKEEYDEIGRLIGHDFDISRPNGQDGFKNETIEDTLIKYVLPIPLSRAAFAESEFAAFAAGHKVCQYVICGAGMDTFAFRNINPGVRIFEVDHPDTQRYKLEKIKKLEWIIPKNVRYVPVDFSNDDMASALTDAGFDPYIPSFFTVLGVTYYLTADVFGDTVGEIAALSCGGGEIVFDFPDEPDLAGKDEPRILRLSEITSQLGEEMLQGCSVEEIRAILQKQGFRISTHKSPDEIQRDYFKNRTDGQRAFENVHFIAAKKEAASFRPKGGA
jgi:methyltransferase (TIGR00027 family)